MVFHQSFHVKVFIQKSLTVGDGGHPVGFCSSPVDFNNFLSLLDLSMCLGVVGGKSAISWVFQTLERKVQAPLLSSTAQSV